MLESAFDGKREKKGISFIIMWMFILVKDSQKL